MLLHAYIMYAKTNGIIKDTILIVFKVNNDDDALLMVKEEFKSEIDG